MKQIKGSYRTQDGKAQIDFELCEKEAGKLVFSASGDYAHSCGQCIDEIATAYPQDATVQEMADVWRKYHLNDMRAGTSDQEAELKRHAAEFEAMPYPKEYYTWACGVLKAAGLYEVHTGEKRLNVIAGDGGNVTVPTTYVYGSAWLYSPIPAEVISKIESWAQLPAHKPLHQDAAKDWLRDHGLKMRITLSDTKTATWEPAGHHYRVTVTREAVKGARLVFDWWGSVAMMEERREPTAYDVLACISSDAYTPESFEDFCGEYGYDADSIKALQTFRRADRFAKRLREFFTQEEIESLSEIQ